MVILGLGNTILSDDGAGIYVVRLLRDMLEIPDNDLGDDKNGQVTIKEASLGGFNFIDLLTGFDRAVIIDAIHTKSGKPGEYYELDPAALKPSARLSNLHGIDFATAVQMARDMGVPFPKEQIAGSMAFKLAEEAANPVLLEPIMHVEVTVPQSFMGDITSDISSRRGRVAGMDSQGDAVIVKAQVPLAELYKYSTSLRSMTAGAASHTMSFSHYEQIPAHIAQKVVDEHKKSKEPGAVEKK